MKFTLRYFLFSLIVAAGMGAGSALADDASDFAEDASAKGLAEIETSRLALQKSQSADVKKFAQQMIDDHTAANQSLKDVAQRANVALANDAKLLDKAKKSLLKQQEGKEFDADYAKNQVTAHEQTIELFQEYVKDGKNAQLKAFAQETLPKLKHHLEMAQQLKAAHPEP